MARGEFVYFVDNDDWLESDAIERMHAMAVRDRADIVIGKVVGHGKRVPRDLFRENLHAVPFDSPKLLGLLTPHKLFRRGMLLEHGIRFPEGRRRLEDHHFVVHAYFHAAGISVLADRPCYHWALRDRARHASYRRMEPDGYFGNVREVLDLVEEHTGPGELRDALLAHWYRGKMLGRAGGSAFARREEAFNRGLVRVIRRLAHERYDEGVHARLPLNLRVRSQLLRAGRYEALRELARFEAGLRARPRVRMRADGDALAAEVRATLPLEFLRDGERIRWRPPAGLRETLADADLDATDMLETARVQPYLHSLRDGAEHVLGADTEVELGDGAVRPVLTARVRIDPATAAAGEPLPAGSGSCAPWCTWRASRTPARCAATARRW